MKPLLKKDLNLFLQRFNYFIDSELRHVQIVSPTTICIILAAQDSARAFDWITVELEFSGVNEAKLLDENRISFLDMSDGITLLNEDNLFAFAVSKCSNISTVKSSTCHVVALSVKYKEGLFSNPLL